MRAPLFAIALALVVASATATVVSCRTSSVAAPGDVGFTAPPDGALAVPADAGAAADAAFVCPIPPSTALVPKRPLHILMFTKETQYFHTDAHDAGERTIPAALRARGHTVEVTNDVAIFTPAGLAPFDVLVFFITSGRVLIEDGERAALLSFVHAGKGIAGAHTANATDGDWIDQNGRFVMDAMWGGSFYGHGAGTEQIAEAGLVPDDANAISSFLPNPWIRQDEWYFYYGDPESRPSVHTLVALDERWIEPFLGDGGEVDGAPPQAWYPMWGYYGDAGHPISWTNEFECARVFYTAMGHTGQTWTDDLVIRHFVAGIEWAGAPAAEH